MRVINPVQERRTKEGNYVITTESIGSENNSINERTIGIIHEKLDSKRVRLKLSNGDFVNVTIDKIKVVQPHLLAKTIKYFNKRKNTYALLPVTKSSKNLN